jgi:hypothetical protein
MPHRRKDIVAMTFPVGGQLERIADGKLATIKSIRGAWINLNIRPDSPSSIQCYPVWQAIDYFQHIG